jgi:hypothetical protein
LNIEQQRFAASQASGKVQPIERPLERPPRRGTVVAGISAAIILLLLILGFLFYRAMMHPEPRAVVVVKGNEAWLGAKMILTGQTLSHPYETVMERADRFSVPFFVPPGAYELTVRVGDRDAFHRSVTVGRRNPVYIELPSKVPATQPVAAPGD